MKWLGPACFLVFCTLRPVFGQSEGIFADFSTSKGVFTVWLDDSNAPRAVASFVGLATGEGGWADPQGNVWHKPFYDGSLFHRVVKTVESNEVSTWTNGIAIQGGGIASVSGTSTNFANAGYTMLESVTNGLVHSNGVISLANSGPNSDGSQFFITATNRPAWDGSFTVFGHVTTGMNVVTSIAAMAVQGSGERPVQDVVLSNVVIRRVGAAATNFNIATQGVPVVESGPMSATISGSNLVLRIEQAQQSEMSLRESPDLQTWDSSDWGFYTNASTVVTGSVPRAALGDTYFFHASRICYSVPITTPANYRGRIYTFVWNTVPAVTNEAHFGPNAITPGISYEWVGTNAVVTNQLLSGFESWTRDAYSAYLVSLDSRNFYTYYSLGFNPGEGTNRFKGRRVNGSSGASFSFSGVFTVR